jgi:Spy/CpxP family protein refolding chaperone
VKKLVLLCCGLLALPGLLLAQNPDMDRRQMLQGQIIQRFMDHATTQLKLDQATRAKLEQQLRDSGAKRRELAQSTAQLRRRMMDETRDSTTSEADLKKLLGDMTALRQREEDLWKSDQDALARILTPRQQVRFVFMWLRFNEQVREMALRPPQRPFRP